MPKFVLEINLGNDAMRDDEQIVLALQRVEKDILNNGTSVKRDIRDVNGNVVGFYEVRE